MRGTAEHILVIEADPIQSECLRAALEYCGYTCDTAATAAAALDRFQRRMPDAIVADPGLPDCDGLELISLLRFKSQVPIIVLSRRSAESVKVAALDKGADDYIEKPFDPGEFVARLRAKLRLFQNDELERFADANQEPPVDLGKMERALLSTLVKHQGATVAEQDLIAAVWGPNGRATETDLRVLVHKVRRKLDWQKQPLYVLRDPAGGYYVAGWVELPRRAASAADVSEQKLDLVRQQLLQQSVDLAGDKMVRGSRHRRAGDTLPVAGRRTVHR